MLPERLPNRSQILKYPASPKDSCIASPPGSGFQSAPGAVTKLLPNTESPRAPPILMHSTPPGSGFQSAPGAVPKLPPNTDVPRRRQMQMYPAPARERSPDRYRRNVRNGFKPRRIYFYFSRYLARAARNVPPPPGSGLQSAPGAVTKLFPNTKVPRAPQRLMYCTPARERFPKCSRSGYQTAPKHSKFRVRV